MTRAAAAALALASLAAAPAAAEPLDIQWFKDNPAQREAWLLRCHGDARFFGGNIGACRNAEAADASTLGRPLRNPAPARPRPPAPAPRVPQQRGTPRAA